ncbi:MAG: DUF952 domain-containing protein [Myxococcota bacterium]
MTVVYRILTASEWKESQTKGALTPNALDQRSGFMHFSSESEVLETAARYFAAKSGPVALRISTDDLGDDLKWEPVESRGGVAFPHLYADSLPLERVHAVLPLKVQPDGTYCWGEARSPLLPNDSTRRDLEQGAE